VKIAFQLYSKVVVIFVLLALAACGTTTVRNSNEASREASGDVRVKFSQALQFMSTGAYSDAIDLLLAINKQNNGLPGVHANLGIAYGKMNEFKKAKDALEVATDLKPNDLDIQNEMAIAYKNVGDYASSKASYERVLSINPKSEKGNLNMGILCDLYINDAVCAIKYYQAYEAIYAERAVVPADAKQAKAKESLPPLIKKNEKVVNWIKDLEKRK